MAQSKQNRLRKAIEDTAEKLENSAKDAVEKVSNKVRNRTRSGGIKPHKHCRMCGITIPANSEKRVCKEDECVANHEKEEKTRSRLRLWLLFFGAFFIFGLIGPIIMGGL